MSSHRFIVWPLLIILAGCGVSGGGGSGALSSVVSKDTAPFAILDLASREISWHLALPSGDADPALRTTRMAFRRVAVGGGEALIGLFEVTQAQWQQLYGTPAPATWPWQAVPDEICDGATAHGGNRPAYNLDHESVATVLVAFGSLAAGGHLALPTDAQWSAACTTGTGWWWGGTATQAQIEANAVVRESVISTARLAAGGIDVGGPLAVGSRAANPLGFHDLHGNVWELIAGGDHARGGSWRDAAWQSRAESTSGSGQGFHAELDHALVGVRLVLVP
jgi:formylglycine-generating enzyme required for sulfatase activity